MSGWRREGCRITASPDLNTLFPASANAREWAVAGGVALGRETKMPLPSSSVVEGTYFDRPEAERLRARAHSVS
jgi:hypothetical protein